MPGRVARSSTRRCGSSRASSAARRVNAGVVLFCRPLRFLGARTQLDERAARRARRPSCDPAEVRPHAADDRADRGGRPAGRADRRAAAVRALPLARRAGEHDRPARTGPHRADRPTRRASWRACSRALVRTLTWHPAPRSVCKACVTATGRALDSKAPDALPDVLQLWPADVLRERGRLSRLRHRAAAPAAAGRPAARGGREAQCAPSSRWPAASCDADAALVSEIRGGREVRALGGRRGRLRGRLGRRCEDTICARLLDGRIGALVADARAEPSLRELAGVATAPFGAYLGVPFTTARRAAVRALLPRPRGAAGPRRAATCASCGGSPRACARCWHEALASLICLLVLAGCGGAAADGRADGATAAGGRAPAEDRLASTRRSTSPRRPATRAGCSSSSRAGRSAWCKDGKTLATPFLDVSEQDHRGRRAGPALDRVRARLRDERAVLRLLHRQGRQRAGRRVQARERRRRRPGLRALAARSSTTRSPTTTAGCCCSGRTSCSTSGSATAAAAGDQHGAHGNGQNLGTLLGKILRIDPQGQRRQAVHDPGRQPVRGPRRARAARSTATGCATRGASRSTARPAT